MGARHGFHIDWEEGIAGLVAAAALCERRLHAKLLTTSASSRETAYHSRAPSVAAPPAAPPVAPACSRR